MTPENGGKIELKLGAATSELAEYEAKLETPTGIWRSTARVGASVGKHQVELGAWVSTAAAEPPEWLMADARAALKAALRTQQAESRWPRRLTRWRPEPAG
jgi:hypothetical protein